MENRISDSSLCEKFEIALYCGEELSDAVKEHIAVCPHCQKLLEENKKLTRELAGTNLTGIADGDIADAVMKKISLSKKKSGFNFSHHMGTAAAIVIICAAALYVKYFPTAEDISPITANEESALVTQEDNASPILEGTQFITLSAPDGAEPETEEAVTDSSAEAPEAEYGLSDSGDAGAEKYSDMEAPTDPPKFLKSARPPKIQSESITDSSDDMADGINTSLKQTESDTAVENGIVDLTSSAAPYDAQTQTVTEEAVSQSAPEQTEAFTDGTSSTDNEIFYTANENTEAEDTDSWDDMPLRANGSGSSGGGSSGGGSSGGGGGSSSASKPSLDKETADIYSDDYPVFEGLSFMEGDENIDANISLANSRLFSLYGEGRFVIRRYALENNGWNGNAFFFDVAPSMTYSVLVSLENSCSPISG